MKKEEIRENLLSQIYEIISRVESSSKCEIGSETKEEMVNEKDFRTYYKLILCLNKNITIYVNMFEINEDCEKLEKIINEILLVVDKHIDLCANRMKQVYSYNDSVYRTLNDSYLELIKFSGYLEKLLENLKKERLTKFINKLIKDPKITTIILNKEDYNTFIEANSHTICVSTDRRGIKYRGVKILIDDSLSNGIIETQKY